MITFFPRPFGAALLFLLLAGCASPMPADAAPRSPILGLDLGGAPDSAPAPAAAMSGHEGMHHPRDGVMMAHADHAQAQGSGTINAINADARSINLSHGPIAALGWPAMTMDFVVAPTVNLHALKPGTRINFTIEHSDGDRYIIQSVTPAGGGR